MRTFRGVIRYTGGIEGLCMGHTDSGGVCSMGPLSGIWYIVGMAGSVLRHNDLNRTSQIHRSWSCGARPAAPNYPLRCPKYHLIESIRPLMEVHGGVLRNDTTLPSKDKVSLRLSAGCLQNVHNPREFVSHGTRSWNRTKKLLDFAATQ